MGLMGLRSPTLLFFVDRRRRRYSRRERRPKRTKGNLPWWTEKEIKGICEINRMAEDNSKQIVPPKYDVNAKWDACVDLTVRRFVYSSLGGAFAGLLFFSQSLLLLFLLLFFSGRFDWYALTLLRFVRYRRAVFAFRIWKLKCLAFEFECQLWESCAAGLNLLMWSYYNYGLNLIPFAGNEMFSWAAAAVFLFARVASVFFPILPSLSVSDFLP